MSARNEFIKDIDFLNMPALHRQWLADAIIKYVATANKRSKPALATEVGEQIRDLREHINQNTG